MSASLPSICEHGSPNFARRNAVVRKSKPYAIIKFATGAPNPCFHCWGDRTHNNDSLGTHRERVLSTSPQFTNCNRLNLNNKGPAASPEGKGNIGCFQLPSGYVSGGCSSSRRINRVLWSCFKGRDFCGLVRKRRRSVIGSDCRQVDILAGDMLGTGKKNDSARRAVIDDVPHLTEWLPDLQTYPNPLKDNPAYTAVKQYFVEDDDVVVKNVVVKITAQSEGAHFRRAGPRNKVYFKGGDVRACIVTCGGLCPGLNTVIREIVCGLWSQYGVRDILGIVGGYAGFYSSNTLALNPKVVNDIHKRGGTVLGTSRGGHDTGKIVSAIIDRGINQVYIIGGDGTQKGADVICQELRKLGLKVTVAGIPKTIDNDIAVIDKSFGFDTAVEEAQRAINAAHVEAECVKNGVGLVKLMGRYSGYIALYATLASRDVDCCLIPEVPFYMEGGGGMLQFVERRLKENGHMVIVVAEGAGQELMAETTLGCKSDASGNRLLLDVGLWLSQTLKDHFTSKKMVLNLKYIDPTYMIRAIPSNASDNVYCTLLAHSAIHGAMAGYTGFTVGPVNGRHAYIPVKRVTETQNRVNVSDRMWARLLSSTNQPDFLDYEQVTSSQKANVNEKKDAMPAIYDLKTSDVHDGAPLLST